MELIQIVTEGLHFPAYISQLPHPATPANHLSSISTNCVIEDSTHKGYCQTKFPYFYSKYLNKLFNLGIYFTGQVSEKKR